MGVVANIHEATAEIMNDMTTRSERYDIDFKLNYLKSKLLLIGYGEDEVLQAVGWAALKWS